eukprot:Rhum_TRINITY_DN16978_c0_g1::Rhum_TRINITY_DN16978_c0_g1_i1::g.164935::m.164935
MRSSGGGGTAAAAGVPWLPHNGVWSGGGGGGSEGRLSGHLPLQPPSGGPGLRTTECYAPTQPQAPLPRTEDGLTTTAVLQDGTSIDIVPHGKPDVLAYVVATLCATDVVLCMRMLHVRTVFGLLFSACGLYGAASRRRSYVLMYVVHTVLTLIRGAFHTGDILVKLVSELNSVSDDDSGFRDRDSQVALIYTSIAALVALELIEVTIARVVWQFYRHVRDEEIWTPIVQESLREQYAPMVEAVQSTPDLLDTLAHVVDSSSPTPPAKPAGAVPGAVAAAQSGVPVRRRGGKKIGRR